MEDTGLRDELAMERTRLANERTVLAYVRTSLALLGGGAALLHFFPDYLWLHATAWTLMLFGTMSLIVGIRRFVGVNERLRKDSR
jgi:putative membrane protein